MKRLLHILLSLVLVLGPATIVSSFSATDDLTVSIPTLMEEERPEHEEGDESLLKLFDFISASSNHSVFFAEVLASISNITFEAQIYDAFLGHPVAPPPERA